MSPILGIYASSNYQRITDTGDMFPISTVTVGSAGVANIEFTSIPATYTHLQLRYIVRTSQTASGYTYGEAYVQFNSDTGSNYSYHLLAGNGSSASASGLANQVQMGQIDTALNNITSNVFGVGVIDILDYANTNKNKTIRTLGGLDNNGAGVVTLSSGNWRNTNAITSIKILPYSNGFTQYTSFALYGIQGA